MITIKMTPPTVKTVTINIPHISGFMYSTHPRKPELSAQEQESNNKLEQEIQQHQAYIQEQYRKIGPDVTAIKFSTPQYLGMSTDLLRFAIDHLLPQINDVEIDLKKAGYDFVKVIPNTPPGVHTLRLPGDLEYGGHKKLNDFLLQPTLSEHIKHLDIRHNNLSEIFGIKEDILGGLPDTLESLDLSDCGVERFTQKHLSLFLRPLPKKIKKIIFNGVVDKNPFYQPLYRDKPNRSAWDSDKERLFLTTSEIINCTPKSISHVAFAGKKSLNTKYVDLHGKSRNIPTRIVQLDLSNNDLGSNSLESLYTLFAPYLFNNKNTIEIIADDKLYVALQELLNFEQLLQQVADYVKNNPKQIPYHNPIEPKAKINTNTAIQYIKILQSRNFEYPNDFIAALTLALLFSGGIVNDYANHHINKCEKLTRDQEKAAAYMRLLNMTHHESTPELYQQVTSLIKELGLEYDISTRRQDLVKKYCSHEQNQLAELIDCAIAKDPFVRIPDEQILAEFNKLIFKLIFSSQEQLNNSGKMLQILEQLYYWLYIFFKHNRPEGSSNELIQLFENNKNILQRLDHKDLVEKCTEAHNFFLIQNKDLFEQDIPSTPSAEFLWSLYINSLFSFTDTITTQFKQFNNVSKIVKYVNISADSLRTYALWDTNIAKYINGRFDLLFVLFYSGIIVNTNSNSENQVDLHKALDFLNNYANVNTYNCKVALHLLHYIVNKNDIEDESLITTIQKFLEDYGTLDNTAVAAITLLLDKTTTRNDSAILFSSQRGSQDSPNIDDLVHLDRFSTREQNHNIDEPEVKRRKRKRCCNIM